MLLAFAVVVGAFQAPSEVKSTRLGVMTAPETAESAGASSAPEADVAKASEPSTTTTTGQQRLRFKRYAGMDRSALSSALKRPALLDGSHAGDYGFDPAGFATSNEELYGLMESEVRHCRLAMLCAAGWPMSELRGDDLLLASNGRAPSLLNGHLLDSPTFIFVLGFFALFALQEIRVLGTPKKTTLYGYIHSQDYAPIADEWPWGVAGDWDFDPLGLYGLVGNDAVGRKVLRDLELSHGRIAMLAVLAYVILEVTTQKAVVDLFPFLFANF
ncbi:hypothetical protein CTAYLR_007167 [Chrysophaeum taylorii]|uniref:Chlorophyll a-b binding protein, chloroplastic n=1 Tax=Chrysophaeum taylorii TaxID=2483200 RepID=A0AAD7UMD1_9STRA|nr:hypothetical protein CTAYLR_007167 [Chrysophaeum taylorii]